MIAIEVNNGRTLVVFQDTARKLIRVSTEDRADGISEGDFVMLLNYYRFVKDNDFKCDFINPNGKKVLPNG